MSTIASFPRRRRPHEQSAEWPAPLTARKEKHVHHGPAEADVTEGSGDVWE
jgi:hypothetical protein